MKKIFTLFFCMTLLGLVYSQTTQNEALYDVEIVITDITEDSGTLVISIHNSAESFNKRHPYRTVDKAIK